jgi:hypothetical protein
MPKGSPSKDTAAWKQNGKVMSVNRKKSLVAEEGRDKARIRVGDKNMKYLTGDNTEAVHPDTDDLEKAQKASARKYNMDQRVKRGKARALKAGKARIKDDFDDVVGMVKEKKSAKRNDYGA